MLSHPHSEPEVHTRKKRPCYVRAYSGPVTCHPTQLARARLGDIGGAVYLPGAETSSSLSMATKTSISLFRNLETNSPASLRTSSPDLESKHTPSSQTHTSDGRQHSGQSADFRQSNERKVDQDAGESVFTPLSSIFSSIDDSPSFSPVSSICHESDIGKYHEPYRTYLQSLLVSSGRTIETQRKIETLDGACDEEHLIRRTEVERASSLGRDQSWPSKTVKSHLMSDEDLRNVSTTGQNVNDSSYFSDPFTGSPALDDVQFSDFSGASAYLRPTAFAGHRDTFARIRPSFTFDSEESSPACNLMQRRASIDFSTEAGKRFPGHRDTLARLHFNRNKSKLIPTQVLGKILRYLSFDDYKHLRLTCRQWYKVLPCVMVPLASRLPAEVLHHIYEHLRPCDFDAARHTCGSWFLASLDRRTGHSVMEKAGCYPAFLADIDHRRQILHSRHLRRLRKPVHSQGSGDTKDRQEDDEDASNEEWLISKRLATECRLSAGWHGSGIMGYGHSATALTTTDIVDFHKLVLLEDNTNQRAQRFTTSGCGRFVLVIVRTNIFVYSLCADGAMPRLRVRLDAGKEVLKASMDSTSGYYAVGALLEDRTGMYWEIDDIFTTSRPSSTSGGPLNLGLQTHVYGSNSSFSLVAMPFAMPENSEKSIAVDEDQVNANVQHMSISQTPEVSRSASSTWQPALATSDLGSSDLPCSSAAIPLRTKPSKVYKTIGYPNDRPRSVAICPQRKCIAFGCKTGIELHWVDASTGSDLNRWLPLAAPSDFLHFIPQRAGIDSVKKLRLVSSSIGPRRSRSDKIGNTSPKATELSPRYASEQQQSSRPTFYRAPSTSAGANHQTPRSHTIEDHDDHRTLHTIDCDHFRAVPLSDGTHMLFTDPLTGLLCLGSDAPTGGPTKLIRKACMVPPTGATTSSTLSCYVAGRDLSWGVRIVAAYDDGNVFLYNVPSEHFERLRYIRSSSDIWEETAVVVPDVVMVNRSNGTNLFQSTSDPPSPGSRASFRSLKINGSFVCRVNPDVEDMQVDCYGGGLRLWIFSRGGQARKMDIYAPRNHLVRSHVVNIDGQVRCMTDPIDRSESIITTSDGGVEAMNEDQPVRPASELKVKFLGLDGACDYEACCDSSSLEEGLERLEMLHQKSRDLVPDQDLHSVPQEMAREGNGDKLSVEILTDFRNTMLLSPYMLNLE